MSDNRLSNLDHKNVSGDVRIYSNFVKSLRIILPLMCIIIVGVLLLWPQLSKIKTEPLDASDLKALKQAKTANTLSKPIFNTLDEKGNLVEISADNAKQKKDGTNNIILNKPSAKMNDNGDVLQFDATQGTYNQETKILILQNGVRLQDSNNNILETNHLTADVNKNIATSDSPAKLITDQGVIEGQSVVIDQQNQTTIFKGPAKAVINP